MEDHEDQPAGVTATRITALAGLAAGLVLVVLSLDLLIHPDPPEEAASDRGD